MRKREQKEKARKEAMKEESFAPAKKAKSEPSTSIFDKGLKAEKICGATEKSGELQFLIKW